MKRFLIIGFILILLIGAPIAAYFLINQNTNNQSHANPASSLLFEELNNPVAVGQPVKVTVDVNPSSNGSTNAVSFVKLDISYDGSKLKADNSSLVPAAGFPVTLEGPTNTCNGTACTISATLSIGPDPSKAISTQSPVAVITFTPLAVTDANAPTPLSFVSGQNQILSLATSDQPAENVFTRGIPLSMTIVSSSSLSGTPTETPVPGQPTDTPVPTSGGGGGGSNGNTNQPPVCSNLTVTQIASDTSGLSYQIGVTGTDSDGTISKVTFNFGDGKTQDVTSGNTIGTANINESTTHSYTTGGTYTVSALLTDDQGAISIPSTCSKAISVAGGSSNNTISPTQIAQAPGTPTPTSIPSNPKNIPPTGPGNTLLAVGLAGVALVTVGVIFMMGF